MSVADFERAQRGRRRPPLNFDRLCFLVVPFCIRMLKNRALDYMIWIFGRGKGILITIHFTSSFVNTHL